MKTISLLLVGSFLVGSLAFGPLVAAEGARADAWESLFNGRDLAGWHIMNDVTAEVVDGDLRIVKGMGWLRSEKEYADFVFECEWRAREEKYDSGFYLRAGMEGKPWPKGGWQVNLRFDMLGALVGGGKRQTESISPVPLNQWVKFRLEVKGKKVTLLVDDKKAWEFEEFTPEKGYLGIQVENRSFDFRNLRIQELR